MLFARVLPAIGLLLCHVCSSGAQRSHSRPQATAVQPLGYNCPEFTTIPTVDSLPPHSQIYLARRRSHSDDDELGLRKRTEFVAVSARRLALPASILTTTALQAGHVLVFVAGVGRQPWRMVLAATEFAWAVVSVRVDVYQPFHILPPYFIYGFVSRTRSGDHLRALRKVLPNDGTTTELATTLRNGVLNAACNIMLIPGWLVDAANLLYSLDRETDISARWDALTATFLREYLLRTKEYFSNAAFVTSHAIAAAAADIDLQEQFVNYAMRRFHRALMLVSRPTRWSGPRLAPLELSTRPGGTLQIHGQCHGRCLADGNGTSINETASASESVASSSPTDGFYDLGAKNFTGPSFSSSGSSTSP